MRIINGHVRACVGKKGGGGGGEELRGNRERGEGRGNEREMGRKNQKG